MISCRLPPRFVISSSARCWRVWLRVDSVRRFHRSSGTRRPGNDQHSKCTPVCTDIYLFVFANAVEGWLLMILSKGWAVTGVTSWMHPELEKQSQPAARRTFSLQECVRCGPRRACDPQRRLYHDESQRNCAQLLLLKSCKEGVPRTKKGTLAILR